MWYFLFNTKFICNSHLPQDKTLQHIIHYPCLLFERREFLWKSILTSTEPKCQLPSKSSNPLPATNVIKLLVVLVSTDIISLALSSDVVLKTILSQLWFSWHVDVRSWLFFVSFITLFYGSRIKTWLSSSSSSSGCAWRTTKWMTSTLGIR